MSSINTVPNSGYYQLSGQSGGANASQSNPTDALLQALSNTSSGTSSGNSDAFLLDLSPQAQQYLNGNVNGAGGTGVSDPLGNNASFTLTSQQQQAITAILTKYKDSPYNQDTYNKIQNDLSSAGLNPSVLSLEDQAKSFDPAMVLINALNGGNTPLDTGVTRASQEQAKAGNFMQQIISQWQNMSSTYKAAQSGGVAVAAAGSTGGA